MNEEAIEKLAREIAEKDTRCEIPEVHEAAVNMNTELIKRILCKVLRTHCIVSKSEVMEAYKYATTPTNEFTPSRMRKMVRFTLEDLFGSDLFKDNSNGSE
jgi:hypothetical protein